MSVYNKLFKSKTRSLTKLELLERQLEVMEKINQALQQSEKTNRDMSRALANSARRPVVINALGNFIGSAVLALIVLMLTTRSKWAPWLNSQFDKIANASPGTLEQTAISITNVLLFFVGSIAVIMIVLGGLRYVVSNGDPRAVVAAKNTIMYAIVGIVVAIVAFALVNFVVGSY